LRVGTSHIDFTSYEATRGGEPVHLSPKAYGLLKLLWERHGQAVTRTDILQQVWGYDVFPTTRTVDNHIAELRAALEEEPSKPQYLLTVHGVGYKLVAATEA
jgi:DNA-binding response OmpR family regulator